MPPETAIRGFLDALGAAPAAVPAGLPAQAALYRTLVSGKRMLIVLDNARDSAAVEPLLPGGTGCTVLVTSRNHLTGLVARGAHAMRLPMFTPAEAGELLVKHLGAAKVGAEADATAALVRFCAGLPPALSVVAARAGANPEFPPGPAGHRTRRRDDPARRARRRRSVGAAVFGLLRLLPRAGRRSRGPLPAPRAGAGHRHPGRGRRRPGRTARRPDPVGAAHPRARPPAPAAPAGPVPDARPRPPLRPRPRADRPVRDRAGAGAPPARRLLPAHRLRRRAPARRPPPGDRPAAPAARVPPRGPRRPHRGRAVVHRRTPEPARRPAVRGRTRLDR
ncbi:NB-ARC domain-containing protein [Amycolatopsis sp. NPDC004747]